MAKTGASRRATEARLERVEAALARWDQIAAANLRPAEDRPDIRRPVLGRRALESLRDTLLSVLREMDEALERRN